MMPIDVDGLATQIISQASASVAGTWTKIQTSAPHFIRAYAQTIASVASGLAKGELTRQQAKSFEKNARLLLVMGIANTSQIIFVEAERFIEGVLGVMKSTINAALPIAIL